MEWGLSLVSHTAMYAADLAHGDASKLQIVCPVCSEALFLRIREKPRHLAYLAHYRRVDDADCELRVLGMPRPASTTSRPVPPRDQELARFFSEFQTYTMMHFSESLRLEVIRRAASMKRRPTYRKYMLYFRDIARDTIHTPMFDGIVAANEDCNTPEAILAIRQTMEFLLAPNSYEPLLFATVFGLLYTIATSLKDIDAGEGDKRTSPKAPTSRQMMECSNKAVLSSQRELLQYLRSLDEVGRDIFTTVHLGGLILVAYFFVRSVAEVASERQP